MIETWLIALECHVEAVGILFNATTNLLLPDGSIEALVPVACFARAPLVRWYSGRVVAALIQIQYEEEFSIVRSSTFPSLHFDEILDEKYEKDIKELMVIVQARSHLHIVQHMELTSKSPTNIKKWKLLGFECMMFICKH